MLFKITLDERDPALLHDAFNQARTRGDRQAIAKGLMLLGAVTLRNAQSVDGPWPTPKELRHLIEGKGESSIQPDNRARSSKELATCSRGSATPEVDIAPSAPVYASIPDDVFETLAGEYIPINRR